MPQFFTSPLNFTYFFCYRKHAKMVSYQIPRDLSLALPLLRHWNRFIYTNPCLEIPSRSWSAFVVNFKSLSMRSNCLLVLLVSKVGGGLLHAIGWVTWADIGLPLLFTTMLPPVLELFAAVIFNKATVMVTKI